MCSLTMTASKSASSASTANRTSARRSRGGVSVQFSLRIRISLAGVIVESVEGGPGLPPLVRGILTIRHRTGGVMERRRILLNGVPTPVVRDGDHLVAANGRRVTAGRAIHLPPCE